MILTWRRLTFLRRADFGPVSYALYEFEGWRDEPMRVRLLARAGGHHRRIGDDWIKLSDEDDERRARGLIAEHHDSMLALVNLQKPQSPPVAPLTTRPNVQESPAAPNPRKRGRAQAMR